MVDKFTCFSTCMPCACMRMTMLVFCLCVFFVHDVHLQTGGIHVPVHAGAEVQAADCSPRRPTLPCATPGCPQYLKTESINRGVM